MEEHPHSEIGGRPDRPCAEEPIGLRCRSDTLPAESPLRELVPRHHVPRRWVAPRDRSWFARWPAATVACSVFAVLLFLTPTSNVGAPSRTPLTPATSSTNQGNSSFQPYLESPASYPTPDTLPNITGNISHPQIANITIGNTFYYALLFVDQIPRLGYVLDFDTGAYSPAAAQAVALTGCSDNCTQHLPIRWNGATAIAAYGGSPIQSDALTVNGTGVNTLLVAAASSNGSTMVYVSSEAGTPGSWAALNGQEPIQGANPSIDVAIDVCAITVVTRSANATYVWMTTRCNTGLNGSPRLSLSSQFASESQAPPPTSPPSMSSSGNTSPTVTSLAPQSGPPGTWVTVHGTGFSSVASVRIGSEATAFQRVSSTVLRVLVPPGSGFQNLQVFVGTSWSPASCDNQFAYGPIETKGTPEVFGFSSNATVAGKIVTVDGENFSMGYPDEVWFGPNQTQGNVTNVTPTTFKVTVPTGSGTVNVSVSNGIAMSPTTCADLFHYGSFFLFGMTPSSGMFPLNVTLTGVGFTSASNAYFGTKEATSTTYVSSTELVASVPKNSGTVNVYVKKSSTDSDKLPFRYITNPLSVEALVPNQGPKGTEVAIYGTGFNASAYAHFGSKNATSTTFVAPTELEAKSPNSSGTVHVVVHQGSLTSPTTCSDLYSYGAAYTSGLPEIISLSSTQGIGGSNITIYGVGFNTSDSVVFGGVTAEKVNAGLSNSSALNAVVPLGLGNTSVQVESSSGSSPVTCESHFDITGPGTLTATLGMSIVGQITLPATTGAVPITLAQPHPGLSSESLPQGVSPANGLYGGFGWALYGTFVFAAVEDELTVFFDGSPGYWSNSGWFEANLTSLEDALGSSTLHQVGDTGLSIPGGDAGEIALAHDEGNGVFLLMTSDVDGRTDLVSLVTLGVGLNRSGPTIYGGPAFNWTAYVTPPVAGSASDPQLAIAPFDDYYATWLENGGGPARIDEAIFAPSGAIIQSPAVVTGSGGTAAGGNGAGNVSLMVDPSGRPFLTWGWNSGPGTGTIAYTGQYSSPLVQLGYLQAAEASLVKPDFEDFGGKTSLATLEALATSGMSNVSTDIGEANLCGAQQNASNVVYTNDTWTDPPPLIWGPSLKSCTVYIGAYHNLELLNGTGILNANFFMSVETQWLLESLGVGVMPLPDWSAPYSTPATSSKPYLPDTGGTVTNTRGDSVQVAPDTTTDNTVWLRSIGVFQTNTSTANLVNPQLQTCGSIVKQDSPIQYWEYAKISDKPVSEPSHSAHGSFTSAVGLPSPVFKNIYPDDNGTWNATFRVTFQTVQTVVNLGCDDNAPPNGTKVVSPPSGWPTVEEFNLSGTFTTGLDPYPFVLQLVGNQTSSSSARDYSMDWENTVNASVPWIWLNGTCGKPGQCNSTWTNNTPLQYDSAGGGSLNNISNSLGSLAIDIQSTNTSATTVDWPQVNMNEVSVRSPEQTYYASCTFGKQYSAKVWWTPGADVTNITAQSANFTWFTNRSGKDIAGWVQLQAGNSTPINVTGQSFTEKNGSTEFVAEATGLESMQVYSIRFFVDAITACTGNGQTLADLNQYYSVSAGSFIASGGPPMYEQDAPYDSISHEGGGATIAWQIPVSFEEQAGTTFENGSLSVSSVSNSSIASFVLPIAAPLTPYTGNFQFGANVQSGLFTTYAINLTGLYLDTEYKAQLVLNYSTPSNPNDHFNNSITFWYEKDTSGDGLTDWEKDYGWYVVTQNLTGGYDVQHVTANVSAFATNGLVGDFVEKEFGLNPNTVDSADSGMLDTWNLTFNLGAGNGVIPDSGDFQIWNEASFYDPFLKGLQYSPGLEEGGNPIADNITNVSASAAYGITSGDGAPWAARALWSYSALQRFVSLPGVEYAVASDEGLRAVEGSWDGIETLTVEGKLSWGANPLATSTPSDGIPDGARLNPLGGTDLQVTVSSFSVSELAKGDAIATYINAYSPPAPYFESNISDYGGFTSQANAASSGTASYTGSFVVTFPVTPTELDADLNLSLMENISTTSSPDAKLALSTPIYSIDLAAGGSSKSLSISGASLSFSWRVLPIYSKAPTWLLAPANNTTLTPLPTGLSRYSAEQDFDLLVLNDSGSSPAKISQSVDGPQLDWSYSVTLLPGLNNLLVPRSIFLASPLGNALVNATAVGLPSTHKDSALSFHPGDWLGRVTGTGKGSAPGSSNYISVFSSSSQSCSSSDADLCGGVPSNPSLEANDQALQVQAVFWINVSASGDGQNLSSGSAVLADLLGGLLLNSTGGFAGNLLNVTSELSTLGLSSNIVTALANSSSPNDGAYGVPVSSASSSNYSPSSPPPWWDVVASDIWNSVSGAVNTVVTAVSHLISVVWTATIAAAVYLADAAVALANKLGIALVNQAASALRAIGSAMWTALQQVLNFVIDVIQALISAAVAGWKALVGAYVTGLNDSLAQAVSTVKSGERITSGEASAIWQALSGSIWLIGIAAAVAVQIAVGIATAVSFGLSELALLVIGIFVSVTLSVLWPNLGSTLVSTVISKIEGFVNETHSQASNQAEWTIFSESITWIDDGVTGPIAAYQFLTAVSKGGPIHLTDSVSFALAMVTIDMDAYAATVGDPWQLGDASAVMAGLSVFFDVVGIVQDDADSTSTPVDFAVDGLVLALDGLAGYEAIHNVL